MFEGQPAARAAFIAYVLWYVWSKRYARAAHRVLRPLFPWISFLLKSLGPLLGVSYKVVLHESYTKGKNHGWPYYNETIDPQQSPQCVFTWHPHSALTVMPFTLWQPSEVFGREVFIGVSRVLYYLPILREILMVGNCRIADDRVLDQILESGNCLMMQPGGVYEQVHFTDEHEIAYFSANLGFLRKAVKHGLPVVPSYSFGENQLYKGRPDRRKISNFLSRMGLPTPAAAGKFGLPAGLLCLPGKPVLYVGTAISTERLSPEEDEDAVVCRVFKMYLAAVRTLWRSGCSHLPTHVAAKGLRFIYRSRDEGNLISDSDQDDVCLVEAFSRRCQRLQEAKDAGSGRHPGANVVPTLHVSSGKMLGKYS